ncbi:coiled-coil domain-containing protein [Paratissierella segnis]|jgi:peptidoglycan hydrolase CwlO-like protein|uniref:Peptidoglycan hydrolase PcsB coiled-coil domain-containing protein n=1 Tax=Paratissierella segnis TaxID=2763679 RepID=A0A926IGC4_9FIRM|nr:hypothetical protein [Paratissierella segnis]MBC8589437.1 hypothetical protein [Paratissierella segnis]
MKKIISIILIFSILIIPLHFYSYSQSVDEEAIPEANDNLLNLSEEEKNILEELFLVLQDIMEMEEKEKSIALTMEELEKNIIDIESTIEDETNKYNNNLNIMEEVLKSYQRNGSTSFLELILSSDSLGTLLKRINALRDISRNTENLLNTIEEGKEKLIEEKNGLDDALKVYEIRQKELQDALDKKFALKDDLERRLSSLKEEKSKYEDYLRKLETSFKDIKPIFSDTINTFVKMIEDGKLPDDVISITLSPPNIRGVIKEDNLRSILKSYRFPTEFDLLFTTDKLELYMPDLDLYMAGTFEIIDPQTIKLKVVDGKYLGFTLEQASIEELFKNGYLIMNFKSLLGKSRIKTVEIKDKILELYITPAFS